MLRLPLVVHVSRDDDEPVVTRTELERVVAEVNALYRPAGICFALDAVRDLAQGGNLETVRDRVQLRSYLVPRAVNVFLLAAIRDPDPDASTFRAAARAGRKPSGWLNGGHIEAPGRLPATYLIIRAAAGATTLAHELGHFLGEGHSGAAGNIMSYDLERRAFDAAQVRTFRAFARREIAKGTVHPVERCGGAPAP